MKYLTNLYDPKREDAKIFISTMTHETPTEAWKRQMEWLKGKHIGRPQATKAYTVEQLEAMGYVGVYDNDEIGLSGQDAKDFLRALLDVSPSDTES